MKWVFDQLCFCAVWVATVLRQHPEFATGSLTCIGALLAVAATTAYRRGDPPFSGILALSGAIAIGWAGVAALASFGSATALGWGLLGMGCGLATAWSFGVRRRFAGAFMRTAEDGSSVQRPVSARRARLRHGALAADRGEPSAYWRFGIFTAIVMLSAILDCYRLLDVPGELDAYGTQAMVAAKRLLHGELSVQQLVLYREMTQEDCGFSLPFVLWHGLFQSLFGGLSVIAGRSAVAAASLLTLVMMYRVGRAIGGAAFGLASMAAYAFLPSTLFNARREAIFGFSVLLLLALFDATFCFIRRPTWIRAVILGAVAPLIGYGIANIRIMALPAAAALVISFVHNETFRRPGCLRLLLAALVAGILMAPQFVNWSTVLGQVRGRGEHIFSGGFAGNLDANDPRRGVWANRALVVYRNSQLLAKRTVGITGDPLPLSALPSPVAVPALVGLTWCLGRGWQLAPLFLLLFWFMSYLPPALSVWATDWRIMLLGPAQALMIAVVWAEIYHSLRMTRLCRIAGILVGLAAAVLCLVEVSGACSFLFLKSPLPALRDFLSREPIDGPVFLVDRWETSLNFVRWNPPEFGRDSRARISVAGIRRADIPEAIRIIEWLDVPGMIVAHDLQETISKTGADGRWDAIGVGGTDMTALVHTNTGAAARKAWMLAVDALQLRKDSPLWAGMLSYRSPNLFIAPLGVQPIRWTIDVPRDLDRVVALVRTVDRGTAGMHLRLDSLESQVVTQQGTGDGLIGARWAKMGGPLHHGTVELVLSRQASQEITYVDDVIVLGGIATDEDRPQQR